MLKLYAKEINKENYDYIKDLKKENQIYYEIDNLDTNKYKEAIVLENNKCIYYKEFKVKKPKYKILNKNKK